MHQRQRLAVAIFLLVTAIASTAAAQSGPDSPLQALIESSQPAGYVATHEFPNVGSLGADALSAFNPDGVVFTPQDFEDHQIGFYGWNWISGAESAGSRRVINIVGLSSASAAEPRALVADFANGRLDAGQKEADLTIPDVAAFTGVGPDGKQALLDVAFIRNDRAFIVTAVGGDPHQLQTDVASFTQQLALRAESLPSRVESSSRSATMFLAAGLVAAFVVLAALGASVRRSRGRPKRAPNAEVVAPQIP